MPDFIPQSEEIFYNWQENLVSTAVTNATAWNIPEADMTALQGLQETYTDKYSVANNAKKATRTQQQVKDKRDAQNY